MKVYLVFSNSGELLIGAYRTKEKAEQFIKDADAEEWYTFEEVEVQE